MFGPFKDMQKEVMNLAGGAIAFCLVGLLGFLAWAFVFRTMPPDNREPMLMLMGILSANVGQVVGFFFGTSYGSQKKSEAITELTKGRP